MSPVLLYRKATNYFLIDEIIILPTLLHLNSYTFYETPLGDNNIILSLFAKYFVKIILALVYYSFII